MNLLVTGGAGFIGSHFVRRITALYDYLVVNLDKLTYAGNIANLKDMEGRKNHVFIKGDICDRALVENLFRKYRIEAVAHLAAESHVDRSILGPEEFLKTNVFGTHTLLAAARDFWKGGRNVFLNVSTDEVYGSIKEGSFTEDSPYSPNSPYSASKASADHLVRAYNKTYGLPTITTHSSNNYGPMQFPEKLIPVVICNAIKGARIPVYGKGENIRDWLYVEDHARALDMVLHKGLVGENYNIAAGNEWRNIELVKLISFILDEVAPRSDKTSYGGLIEFVTDRPGHDERYSVDASKIKKLGWTPKRPFKDGLKETVRWYLRNQRRTGRGRHLRPVKTPL
jgi:dTDP-glucose 4,6-dehydratase